jgi:5-methylcytosine-specific restriction protein A
MYRIQKEIYVLKSVNRKDGLKMIKQQTNMNASTIERLIYHLKKMLEGKQYTQTMNAYTTEYFLENIYKDFGTEKLKNAISSVKKHNDYYEDKTNRKKYKIREIIEKYSKYITNTYINYPDEIDKSLYLYEGATKKVIVNKYERNLEARRKCIEYFGAICCVCEFNFEKIFGKVGEGFIHVHHLIEISTIQKSYIIDPINDLIPVCPNCHAMIHKGPPYSIKDIKKILNENRLLN